MRNLLGIGKRTPSFIHQEDSGLKISVMLEHTTSSSDMAMQYVPDDIRDFILKHITSVAQIEALLLVWASPEKRWSLSQIAARIYTNETETAKAVEGLCDDGLLSRKDGTFGLNTSEETIEIIGRLREAYARHLIPVTDVIHGRSRDPRSTAEPRRVHRDR